MELKAVSGMMLTLLFIGMLTLAFNIQRVKAEPGTIVVPDNYSTIQQAINHASSGDIIFVKNGTYQENVFVSKAVSLIGENKVGTIIDGGGVRHTVEILANNVTITGFTIRNSAPPLCSGIEIYNYNYANISDNVITNNNGYGVYIYGSSYFNTVSDNIITNNQAVGILIYDPYDKAGWNVIKANNITNNSGSGIGVSDNNGNILEANVVTNEGAGMFFFHAANNTIKNNLIANNQKGIYLWGYHTSGNSFFHNNFINNPCQVEGEYISYNSWDDGYPSGGNYWSDYAGVDLYSGPYQNETSSDGIGDTPYTICADNQDNYPFMSVVGDVEPPVADAGPDLTVAFGTTVTFDGTKSSDDVAIKSYVWTFTDITPQTLTGVHPEYTFNNVGDFEVTLNVSDYANNWNTDTVTVTVVEGNALTIYSSPTGVTFTVGSVSRTTPWSGAFLPNTPVSLIMPEIHTVRDAKYYWNQWSDGNTSRSRTVTMNTNITLTAHYTGPYYQLTVTSSPITGIPLIINGTPQITLYTEWFLEGSYTLEMPQTHNGYVWSHWLEDGDTNRTKTITLQGTTWTAVYTPAPPPPSVGGKATPINIPINKPELQTWIWLIAIILPLVATVALVKLKKKKQ